MEQRSTNTFLKSKMNKDLDERLVPNGEYRDAVNIAISKSEGSNVGAAENIQGTRRKTPGMNIAKQLDALVSGDILIIIGELVHEASGYIYLFLTNQNRAYPEVVTDPTYFDPTRLHWVVRYSVDSESIDVYAGGAFLNFSTYFPINNVNLLENQLFWTDNLNQPRVLDVTRFIPYGDLLAPIPNYEVLPYYKEDQISVCTYSPYKPMHLYKNNGLVPGTTDIDWVTTLQNATDPNLPAINYVTIDQLAGSSNIVDVQNPACLPAGFNFTSWIGLQCWTSDGQITKEDAAYISAAAGNQLTISYRDTSLPAPVISYAAPYVNADETLLYVSFVNPNWQEDTGVTTYPGDQTFLEDKFARFSYRFKFRNGTYSTIAPYTQECFIPKQYGYFLPGDEKATYESTVVSFMENMVNRILLQIIMPEDDAGNIIQVNELLNSLNVSEIDIIYKESDGAALKVIKTLSQDSLTNYVLEESPAAAVLATDTFDITMSTIPSELKRQRAVLRPGGKIVSSAGFTVTIINVVEASPVFTITVDSAQDWALADILTITQSVLEFEYQNNEPYRTLPADQLTRVYDKVPVKALTQEIISNRITYANYQNKHTPPSTIDYQVAVSSKLNPGTVPTNYGGSYSYYAYPNHTVKQNRNYQVGFILSDRYGRTSSVILSSRPNESTVLGDSIFGADTIYHPYKTTNDFEGQILDFDNVLDWPGDSIKILVNDIITSTKAVNGTPGLYNGDDTNSKYNPLGWYSYKVVVKQQEQEYYNVYLPYIINGLARDFGSDPAVGPPVAANPDIPVAFINNSLNEQASIVLINDNINKVPRDLSEVGPDQEQFRSSVRLWGRVTPQLPLIAPYNPVPWDGNMFAPDPTAAVPAWAFEGIYNQQYYPNIVSDVVSTISTQNELYSGYVYDPSYLPNVSGPLAYEFKPGTDFPPIYNSATNPLIALISTQKAIGASGDTDPTLYLPVPEDTWPNTLSVYETAPDASKLDIYWETSTSGLISDLNTAVIENVIGVASAIENLTFSFKENRSLINADPAVVYAGSTDTPYYSDFTVPPNPNGPIISSDFSFVDDLGGTVNEVTIDEWYAVDGEGNDVKFDSDTNPEGLFSILKTPGSVSNPGGDSPWNYRYDGVTAQAAEDTFVVTINNESVYLQNQNPRVFTFTIYTSSQNPSGEWITEETGFTLNLTNVAPVFESSALFTQFKPNCFTAYAAPGTCDPSNPAAPQFRAANGTAIPFTDSAARYEELTMEITSVIKNGEELIAPGIQPPFILIKPCPVPTTPVANLEDYTWLTTINPNLQEPVVGEYQVTIKTCDALGIGDGSLCTEYQGVWTFGEKPVNCSFLMETAVNQADVSCNNVIPTINPRQWDGQCDEPVGLAQGSDAAMIIWTGAYEDDPVSPEYLEPLNWQVTSSNMPINSYDLANPLTGNRKSFYPAAPGVPYVWLWDNGNDPDCADIINPPGSGPGGCTQAPHITEDIPCGTGKDISETSSIDMSYGTSWCSDGPAGLRDGTAYITIKYKQVLPPNAGGISTYPLDIDSNFKVYLQYRQIDIKAGPVDTWTDCREAFDPFNPSPPAVKRTVDIEGTYINSLPTTNSSGWALDPAGLGEVGLLSGNWSVSDGGFENLNGGVLTGTLNDLSPLDINNPYPVPYWELGVPNPTNAWNTHNRVRDVGQNDPSQWTIQISKTIALNPQDGTNSGVGGYRLLISALRGTLTRLSLPGFSPCEESWTNDDNCLIAVEYGDFYYPNGTTTIAWRYEVSEIGAPTQKAAQNHDVILAPPKAVYAREPFFRYVTQFYEDSQLTIPVPLNTSAGTWFMYQYQGGGDVVPGENGTPYGNDGAAFIPSSVSGNIAPQQRWRRWIAQFNSTGGKIPRSSHPTTHLT